MMFALGFFAAVIIVPVALYVGFVLLALNGNIRMPW